MPDESVVSTQDCVPRLSWTLRTGYGCAVVLGELCGEAGGFGVDTVVSPVAPISPMVSAVASLARDIRGACVALSSA